MYLVMEYIQGGDLFDAINDHKIYSERAARSIIKQLLIAILYLHQRGIVHCDIKPENIMLKTDQYGIKYDDDLILTDFGLSKFISNQNDIQAGTITYIAPEILLNNSSYKTTKAVDLWSIGVLYI